MHRLPKTSLVILPRPTSSHTWHDPDTRNLLSMYQEKFLEGSPWIITDYEKRWGSALSPPSPLLCGSSPPWDSSLSLLWPARSWRKHLYTKFTCRTSWTTFRDGLSSIPRPGSRRFTASGVPWDQADFTRRILEAVTEVGFTMISIIFTIIIQIHIHLWAAVRS